VALPDDRVLLGYRIPTIINGSMRFLSCTVRSFLDVGSLKQPALTSRSRLTATSMVPGWEAT
jgi:hypothetical protein